MIFSYDILIAFNRTKLAGAKYFSIGKTSMGKQILATHIGNNFGPQILVQGSIHGREHITSLVIFRQIEFCLRNFKGVGGIYFVPISNPDGVDIALNGTQNVLCNFKKQQLEQMGNLELFKANGNFVDLNVNFDAKWGKGKKNIKQIASENYVGLKPESESETKALAKFLKKINPCFTISYHCKGEVIYYEFGQKGANLKRDYEIAKFASVLTGYKLANAKGSVGGFKDYAIMQHKIPSLTIEVGNDNLAHPIKKQNLGKILNKNLKLPLAMLDKFVKYDIINLCKNSQTSKKKILCELQFWKQERRLEMAKCRLAQLLQKKLRAKLLQKHTIGA